MREIACQDCVVSVLLEIKPREANNAVLSQADADAIKNLAKVGLVPPLRYRKDMSR